MIVNLLFSNTELYECKAYVDFDSYMIIFPTIDNFKAPFQIQRIGNQSIIYKIILREKIVFYPKKIVYVRMNYISLLKERSFIMTAIYPIVPNVFLDTNTPYIVIIVNFTNKILTFNKDICLNSIYKYIDTLYIIINIAKTFTAIVTTSTAVFKPFIAI